jgi:high-affinity Fe2+/Pb2+ permease
MKITPKWICIGLMCATLFCTLGFAYGQMIANNNCNNYWNNNIDSICSTILLKNSQTISTDNTPFHPERINLSDYGFNPIEVKING